jgi:tight junction protein 4
MFFDLILICVIFNRLYEAHKKLQKVNQGLEDKLLRIVDKFETEKSVLARELSSTSRTLTEEKAKSSRLKTENVRIFLQCCISV